ncbi:hypothetical protein ACIPLC_03800 [Kitasatospora sp. NPDC086801]
MVDRAPAAPGAVTTTAAEAAAVAAELGPHRARVARALLKD